MTHTPDMREDAAAVVPALHLLGVLGWQYLSPSQCLDARGSTRAVIMAPVLRDYLAGFRFDFKGATHPLPPEGVAQVIQTLAATGLSEGLQAAAKTIWRHLVHGVTVNLITEGQRHSVTVPLIDWGQVAANRFHVAEEMAVERAGGIGAYRPDLVCFVNGLPLAVVEAKRPVSLASLRPTVAEGISQNLRNQKIDGIPELYAFTQVVMAISGSDARYATTGTPAKFWSIWREEEMSEAELSALKNTPMAAGFADAMFKDRPHATRRGFERMMSAPVLVTDQDRALAGLLRPDRLLDMARRFVFFDGKAGKIIARYQQVQGVKAILSQVRSRRPDGSREGGVIWHTTGSGKSNLMVILSRALLIDPDLAGCRVIVVTDRVDLERQLSGTFLSGGAFGSEIASKVDGERSRAQSGRDLALRIGQGEERIIFTLLQKFTSATKLPECRNTSDKLIVLVDEGHRSQGGENHERMRMALPRAAFIAFTGTPLLKEDKTRNKFGPILHAYTMARAVEDGAVTPLIYEERRPKLSVDEVAVDAWFEKQTADLSEAQKSDLKRKYATRGEVYKAERRIELIAEDIADHFSRNVAPDGLKAQLATDSKMSAIRYKAALDRTGKVTSAVVISAPDTREGHDDTNETKVPEVKKWWAANVAVDPEGYEKRILANFAEPGDPEILIVVDKLLTGFDEPSNAVLYIDKNLKSHNLLQAIARVNRLHDAKKFGYLVDYRGILAELDVSIQDYQDLAAETESGFEAGDLVGTVSNVAMEYKRLPRLHDALWAIFKGVKNRSDTQHFRRILMPQLIEDEAGLTHDENQKRREDFYAALTEFGMCLKLALSSRVFFEDGAFSEQQIRIYKKDLTFFTAIRQQARQDAQETVDFSKYEDQIRRLVDRQVNGQEILDPEGVILLSDLGTRDDDPDNWSDDKIRTEADLIKTRMRKTIEQDLGDDPYAQKVFSDLLKQVIAAADALFDHPHKQFTLLKDLEDQIAARKTPGVPDRFGDNRHAQAFFGAVLDITKSEGGPDLSEEAIVAEAFAIDAAVEAAIRTHSLSPANIEAEVSKTLLTRFYRLLGGLDQAQALVATVIGIVRAGRPKTGT